MKLVTTTILWNCPDDVDTDKAMEVATNRLTDFDSRIVVEDTHNEEYDKGQR